MLRSRFAFSLIELLVVISIIVILVALLLASLSHAREAARDIVCRSQVRQVFQAQANFEADNGRFTGLWTEDKPVGWKDRLSPYLQHADPNDPEHVFHCPNTTHAEIAEQPNDPTTSQVAASIGLNGAMQFGQWDFKTDNVPNPSQIIGMGEQAVALYEGLITSDGYGVWSDGRFTNWYNAPNHVPERGFRHGRHAVGNFVMMDGHVTTFSAAELVREGGHWYWWDALANDTSQAGDSDGGGATYEMPTELSPNPVPKSLGGPFGFGRTPRGPLKAPCGCPIRKP